MGAAIFGVYAIVQGISYAAIGLFSRQRSAGARLGSVLLALLFIAAGVILLANLRVSTAFFAAFIAIAVGVLWIIEGVVSLAYLGAASSKVWTAIFTVISILAGITIVASPLWSAVVLWWFVGATLLVLGIVQIVRAITFPKED